MELVEKYTSSPYHRAIEKCQSFLNVKGSITKIKLIWGHLSSRPILYVEYLLHPMLSLELSPQEGWTMIRMARYLGLKSDIKPMILGPCV